MAPKVILLIDVCNIYYALSWAAYTSFAEFALCGRQSVPGQEASE